MNIKALISFSFAAIFSMVQAQMPVKKSLNSFITNFQELKVKKRSLEMDLPGSAIYMNWDEDNGDWDFMNADTTLYKYSNNGWLIEEINFDSWGRTKVVYTYDGAGRELTSLSLNKYMGGKWDTSSLATFTYDEKGLMNKWVYKEDYYSNRWWDSVIIRYTNKDDQQERTIERISERWTNEDGYEFEEKTLYSYGSDGKVYKYELFEWNDSLNAFEKMIVYDSIVWYQYFENDEFLEKSKPLHVSGISYYDEPENYVTITWSYDKQDNITEQITLNEDEFGDDFKRARYEYNYDSEGRCIEALYFYDEGEKDNIPERRTTYANFYTAPNLATENLFMNQVVYPNPAFDHIRLKEKVTELEILNIQGQQLLSSTILEAETPFNVSSLTAGTYIIRYRNQQGLIRSSQLLIQ